MKKSGGKDAKATQWITSVNQIASVCKVDWKTAAKWADRADFPKRRKSGYPRLEVMEYAKSAKVKSAQSQKGPNADLKAEKLKREIKRLDVLIQRDREQMKQERLKTLTMEKQIIPITDVRTTLSEVIGGMKGALNNFCQRVSAELKDPKALKWAEELRDDVLADAAGRLPNPE